MTDRRSGSTEAPRSLSESLVQLAHVVDHVFADVSREFGLTPQQTQLLCVLTVGPTGMSELSRVLHLERSSLTGLVDRVSGRGLIERTQDTADRRIWRVGLTRRGRQLAVEAHTRITARLDELARATSGRSRDSLARVADTIAASYVRPPSGG